MAQIHLRIDDGKVSQLQQKAAELGMTTNAFICHILNESLKKSHRKEPVDHHLKIARAKVVVIAEALGRTQGASPEATDKLKKTLLKIFDQEVQ